ncbi:MAG TPA: phenylalanine--tRNA ligase subunit beta [Thermoanaerobaculia bacterium]|nr:phenylalanine--tRNA ligase subunit beta [Thermoanaerobaculia bacterium]
MLFSRDWLARHVELPADTGELAHRLTFAGLAVDGWSAAEPAEEEPGAAAAAAAPDDPWTKPPAAPPATSPPSPDIVLDIDVTSNRPDCMCHLGVAREIAVLFDRPLQPIVESERPAGSEAAEAPAGAPPALAARVEIEDPLGCPRYVARVVEGVAIGPSPGWLRRRLLTIGVRPINNVVDVTNFVLWDMGQPMHAFDLDRLAGQRLVVRRARAGERLRTLDGVDRELDAETLVIADAERPVALAGILGGEATEVTAATTRLLLESAHFDRRRVRHTARRLGLSTDASHRFERGADPGACLIAANRAAALIAELAGGRAAEQAIDRRGALIPQRRGRLELPRLNAFAGAEVAAADAERWLSGLGFSPHRRSSRPGAPSNAVDRLGEPASAPAFSAPQAGGRSGAPDGDTAPVVWEVTVPSWRYYDFEPRPNGEVYPADLYEEVLRIFGLDRIAATLPALAGSDGPRTEIQLVRDRIRRTLAGAGFAEAINPAFEGSESGSSLPCLRPGARPVAILNPLSERQAVLRRSLLGNLIESARFNQRRGAAAVRLFEIAAVFFERVPAAPAAGAGGKTAGDGTVVLPEEPEHVALAAGGGVGLPWDRELELDFFDLKGTVEGLAAALGVRLKARPADLPGLLPGNAAELVDRAGDVVGILGRLEAEQGYPLYVCELALAALTGGDANLAVAAPSRFPGVSADFTLTHAVEVAWSEIEAAIAELWPPDLESYALKVRYRGPEVPAGAANTTISFFYNARDRSLTHDEINERQQSLAAELTRRFAWRG